MSLRRIFDWKFVVALTVMAMASYLVFVGYTATTDNRALVDLTRRQQVDARTAREAAEARAGKLLDNQARLLRQIEQLQRKQDRLLEYLRAEGVEVPVTYDSTPTEVVPADATTATTARPAPSRASSKPRPSSPKPAPVKPPAAPNPQPEPEPSVCVLILCVGAP